MSKSINIGSFCEKSESAENEKNLLQCSSLLNDAAIKNEIIQAKYNQV